MRRASLFGQKILLDKERWVKPAQEWYRSCLSLTKEDNIMILMCCILAFYRRLESVLTWFYQGLHHVLSVLKVSHGDWTGLKNRLFGCLTRHFSLKNQWKNREKAWHCFFFSAKIVIIKNERFMLHKNHYVDFALIFNYRVLLYNCDVSQSYWYFCTNNGSKKIFKALTACRSIQK